MKNTMVGKIEKKKPQIENHVGEKERKCPIGINPWWYN